MATRDARANARAIAETLGVALGEVISVSAQQTLSPGPPYPQVRLEAAAMSAAETYTSGQIRIEASVSAVFGVGVDDR